MGTGCIFFLSFDVLQVVGKRINTLRIPFRDFIVNVSISLVKSPFYWKYSVKFHII